MWNEKQWAYSFASSNVGKVQDSWLVKSRINYMTITPNLLLVSQDYDVMQMNKMVYCHLCNCDIAVRH